MSVPVSLTTTSAATALLDRLTHHGHFVEAGKESYRFRQSSAAAKKRIKAREQVRRGGKADPTAGDAA